MAVHAPNGPSSRAAQNALDAFDASELYALADWNTERAGHYRLAAEQAEIDGDEDLLAQALALAAFRELRGRVIHRQATRLERAEKMLAGLMDDPDSAA